MVSDRNPSYRAPGQDSPVVTFPGHALSLENRMPPSAPPNFRENKEALRGLTKIAAKEWGQYGICVNIVLPGAESPAAKAWAEKFPEEYAKQVNLNPMKRFGDPEMDIAPVVAFLAGPDSCYFSGQSVIVDGANSIMP